MHLSEPVGSTLLKCTPPDLGVNDPPSVRGAVGNTQILRALVNYGELE